MPKTTDILGLGAVAVDDLLYVNAFPEPDTKTRVEQRRREPGGQTGTALVAAARLGSRCAYAGQLGDCDLGRFVREAFQREGIDTRHAVRSADAVPAHSTIIVDRSNGTRTILSSVNDTGLGPTPHKPDASLIRNSHVLLIDHHGIAGSLRAARIAHENGVPIVADFERAGDPPFDELLHLADHLIVSERFAICVTGKTDPADATRALWHAERKAVIVTCGERGGHYIEADTPDAAGRYEAFAVDTIDTTGCGDVFHGAYAAMLARETPFSQRILIAKAAAAIKAQRPGGQSGIPTFDEVREFLASRGFAYPIAL